MSEHRRVLRYEVPVDGRPHPIADGPVLMAQAWRAAAAAPAGRVEIWVEVTLPDGWPDGGAPSERYVQVFGTGQRIPSDYTWLASCLDGTLVWHVYGATQ